MELKFEEKKEQEENLIPLINIVFLILIFFLIATIIRPFTAKDIDLASAKQDDQIERLTHVIMIDKEGGIRYEGRSVNLEALLTTFADKEDVIKEMTLNIIADKALVNGKLLDIVNRLGTAKFKAIKLIIEKAE